MPDIPQYINTAKVYIGGIAVYTAGMYFEGTFSIMATLGGGFFASALIGYFIKKIIKILMFVFGGILTSLMYPQSQEKINVVIKSSAEAAINAIRTNITQIFPTVTNPSFIDIPLTGSIVSIFVFRITRRAK